MVPSNARLMRRVRPLSGVLRTVRVTPSKRPAIVAGRFAVSHPGDSWSLWVDRVLILASDMLGAGKLEYGRCLAGS